MMRLLLYTMPLLLTPLAAGAELPLSGDTYVVAQSGSNFGAQANLLVAPGTRSLLQFDLSALPAGTTAAQVARANLRLYVNRVTVPGQIDVALAGAGWTESTATGLDLIAAANPVASNITIPAAANYLTVDVTTAVTAWLSGSTVNRGLILSATSANPGSVAFDSKENPGTSHPPLLEVLYSGPQGPTGPAGPLGPAGADANPTIAVICATLGYSDTDGCLFAIGSSKPVFVTANRYDGNLGGLAGADAKCQAEATASGLTGTYRAWLSDSTASPATRFTRANNYQLTDGPRSVIAASFSELTTTGPRVRIQYSAAGQPTDVGVWTGTAANGTATSRNCLGWTSTAFQLGTTGLSGQTTGTPKAGDWTDNAVQTCSATLALYCFRQ